MGVFITDKDGKLKKVAGNFIPKESPNLGCLRTELLWTNPNPNSAFVSQTVELSDGNYDYLIFIYSFRPMSSDDPIQQSVIISKDAKSTALNYYSPSTDLTYHAGGVRRDVIINNPTSITFDDNIHANNATTKATVNNSLGIPIQIIGLYKSPAMIYTGAELHEGDGVNIKDGVFSVDSSVVRMETIYDMKSSDSSINWSYPSGIKTGIPISGKNFSKYKRLRVYCNGANPVSSRIYEIDLTRPVTDVKVSGYPYMGVGTDTAFDDLVADASTAGIYYDVSLVSTDKTTFLHYRTGYTIGANVTSKNGNDYYYIYRIEGVW